MTKREQNKTVKWTDPSTGKVKYKYHMPLRELKKLVPEDEFEAERTRRRNKGKESRERYADYYKQYAREKYHENPERKKEKLAYQREYYKKNNERLKEYQKQYHKEMQAIKKELDAMGGQ